MKPIATTSLAALSVAVVALLSSTAGATPARPGPCYGDADCIEARRHAMPQCPYADANAPAPRAGRGMMGPRHRGGCAGDTEPRSPARAGCPWTDARPATPALPSAPTPAN